MNEAILETKVTQEKIVQKYDRLASLYDFFGILMESKARQRALNIACIQDGERILEVALGTGLNFVEILKRNQAGWVGGIDISMRMLERARRRISTTGQTNYALSLCDSRHLPFEEGTFDVLMNQYMFDILPVKDFIPILLEFKRVLKTGGRIVLVNMTKTGRVVQQFYENISRFGSPLSIGCRGVLLQPFLEDLGFTEVRREFVSRFGFPSEVLMGLKREIPR